MFPTRSFHIIAASPSPFPIREIIMERREFVGASIATLCAAGTGIAEPKPETAELYELRTYTLEPARQPRLDDYLGKALLPALKRFGIGPVGVFTEEPMKNLLRLTVLIVYKNAEEIAGLPARLAADEAYRTAAAAYYAAKPDDPVYQRIESSLLAAIGGMRHLEKPDAAKPRLLNLRIYESHNERAAAKKIEMFEKGELAIFRRVGLTPVFFAAAASARCCPISPTCWFFPMRKGGKRPGMPSESTMRGTS